MLCLSHGWTRGIFFDNCSRDKSFVVWWIEKVKATRAWSVLVGGLACKILIGHFRSEPGRD